MPFSTPTYLMPHVIAEGRLNRLEGVKKEDNPYATVNYRQSWATGWELADKDVNDMMKRATKDYWTAIDNSDNNVD